MARRTDKRGGRIQSDEGRDPKPMTASTPPEQGKVDGVDSPSTTPLMSLVGRLTVPQLWALGAAIATLVGGAFAFGAVFRPLADAWLAAPKLCADDARYPRGAWFVRSVKVESAKKDVSFNGELYLNTSTEGAWYAGTDQMPDGSYKEKQQATFTINPAPSPGKQVTLMYLDKGYSSKNILTVSSDGCSMTGMFSGKREGEEPVFGWVEYCWQRGPKDPECERPGDWRPALIRK
jgi:hypothetical protein